MKNDCVIIALPTVQKKVYYTYIYIYIYTHTYFRYMLN